MTTGNDPLCHLRLDRQMWDCMSIDKFKLTFRYDTLSVVWKQGMFLNPEFWICLILSVNINTEDLKDQYSRNCIEAMLLNGPYHMQHSRRQFFYDIILLISSERMKSFKRLVYCSGKFFPSRPFWTINDFNSQPFKLSHLQASAWWDVFNFMCVQYTKLK